MIRSKYYLYFPIIAFILLLGIIATMLKALPVFCGLVGILFLCISSLTINDFPLYVSIVLYALLPQYFALELSSNLPLITASRFVILYLLAYTIIKEKLRKGTFSVMKHSHFSFIFAGYFAFSLIASIPHFGDTSILKDFFSILFDEILLFILITNSVDTKDKLDKCVKLIAISFFIVCTCGIVERLFRYNFWNNFYTISRVITNANDSRLGVNRVCFSFLQEIYFGIYIVLLIPIILYMLESTKKNNVYKIILVVGIICCFLTLSRGPIVVMFLAIVLKAFDMNRVERRRFRSFIFVAICVAMGGLVTFPEIVDSVVTIVKSILNELGFSFEISNFGSNADGIGSRLFQFDIYGEAIRNNWIFGIGSSASSIYVSVDNAYLGWMLSGGVFGIGAKLILYFGSITLLYKYKKTNKICKAVFYSLLCYMIALVGAPENITTKMVWILLSLAAVSRYIETKSK